MPATAASSNTTRRTEHFSARGSVRLAGDGESAQQRTVEAVLYSGGVVEPFPGVRLCIDLDSLDYAAPKPMLLDHGGVRIGVWSELEGKAGTLAGRGALLNNDAARGVAQDAEDGFPWEASVWVEAEWEQLPRGETVTLNGRQIAGPVEIGRNGRLREASLTAVGVDPDTRAAVLAAQLTKGTAAMADDSKPNEDQQLTEGGETVAVADITADWLRENKPDLVTELVESASDDAGDGEGEGTEPAPVSDDTQMSATLAQLKEIAPNNADLVLAGFESKMTTVQFTAMLEQVGRTKAASDGAGVEPADPDPAQKPGGSTVRFSAGASESEVFDSSEKVRKQFQNSKRAFGKWCARMRNDGKDLDESLAAIGC